MCDVAHHNPFVLGLTAVNEVCKSIIYILDEMNILFLKVLRLYFVLC